jgi:chitin synthase
MSIGANGPSGAFGVPPRNAMPSRDSLDSLVSAQTSNNSVYNPRRVESIMGEEDRKKYAIAQESQRAAGSAYMTGPLPGQALQRSEADAEKEEYKDAQEYFQDRPDHRRVDSYNSFASGDGSSPEPTPPLETASGLGGLAVPQNGRNTRSGGSPLARASLIRTMSDDEFGVELEEQRHRTPSPKNPECFSG